ncbi:ABC transporter permease [Sphingomonas sp. PP-CE-1G-424]|uniref:ABC transporter permease n=1 Tax=Sphingomonas sp. PP-CE-1G-424 TaxID=2135658 RepID=UPI001056259D|nr:ABC transporter permease [Sphingomonas sp. PP-CE-1G-424]TCP71046.1 ABC-2 type transport system permease protein [Sphingomonas sp. PP-CE-1G-424]
MTRFRRTLRQTFTIARRDFIATVFTPIFLLFLFAPAIMGAFSVIGGMGARSAATGGQDKTRIIAIVPAAVTRPIAEADTRLRSVFGEDDMPPGLTTVAPTNDPNAQARAAFETKDIDAEAVLYGPLDAPQILYGPRGRPSADYLGLLAQTTLAAQKLGGTLPTIAATKTQIKRSTTSVGGQHQSAFFAVFGIFFLTLFLSGQVVGTMAEERNNKVIEVLAAAVPLESVFFGKLIGMFGVAVLFVAFWGTVVTQITSLMPAAAAVALGDLTPAVGAPMFALLFAAYFSMAYLLLGSVFLGVGAQATTMREIQMLSLPITILQVAMFGLSSAAVSHPGSWIATAAELFPLSSPFAMAGRAANSPELWPHVAALAWQALWVTIFITVGARLFRRGVLQSGSARPFWRRKAKVVA